MLLLILLNKLTLIYSSTDTTTAILDLESLMSESILSLQKSKRISYQVKKVAFVNCIFALDKKVQVYAPLRASSVQKRQS